MKRLASGLLGATAGAVLVLIKLAAWLLRPFRIGRLLRAVSIPRLQEHRLRTTLTALGVALGVAMLVAVVIVNDSVMRGLAATVDDLAGKTDLQVSAGTSGFNEELVEQVRQTPGVARAVPVLQQTVTVRDTRGRGERLLVLGVDMLENDDAAFRSYGSPELEAIRRDPLRFLNSPHAVLLSRSFADQHGYKLHDTIALATGTGVLPCDIWGFLDDAGVGRAFAGGVAVMYHQAMQVAFDRGHNVDRIDIAKVPSQPLAQVVAQLQAALGDGYVIEPPARRGDRVAKMLLAVRSGLTIASLIAVLVGAFLIHNTMAISVVQRKRELGILRALGTRRKELVALLTLEGFLLGSVGSVLGVLLGIGLSRVLMRATSQALNETYVQVPSTEVHVGVGVLLAGFGLGTLAATLASALPARRAALQPPAETLRTSGLMQKEPPSLRPNRIDALAVLLLIAARPLLKVPPWGELPLGAVAAAFAQLMAASLLTPRLIQLCEPASRGVTRVLGLGVSARLAQRNLPRDLARTASTASALMAGVALAVSFGTFTFSFASTIEDWIDQTLPGDLFITQGAALGGTSMRNIPMADTLYDELAGLPGVASVRRVRIVEMPFRGFVPKVVATDIDIFLKHARLIMLEGTQPEVVEAIKRGEVAISENFARRFKLHVGDRIPLATQSGTREFRVSGVFVDYTSDVGSVLFERSHYMQIFRDTRVDTYELHLNDPRQVEATRREVNRRYSEKLDLFVLTNGEFRAEVRHTTDQIFSLVRALELVALVVAVLGIINTQLANVLDRVREIGVLRALGMLRRQASRMIVIEATLVGAIGTLAGILLGISLGDVLLNHINLVQTGWYFPYRLSLGAIVEVTCLTIPAAAVAGLYPARAATRLVVTEALEYE
ncbi:MAG: FtsX-like permease family protein [Polyangiales bacterium]